MTRKELAIKIWNAPTVKDVEKLLDEYIRKLTKLAQ